MNRGFEAFLALSREDQRDVFDAAARRLDTLSSHVEKDFRWKYCSGSELFVVYTDYRDVTDGLRPNRGGDLRTRGFVIKINKMFRY